jgi:hypothetical protein
MAPRPLDTHDFSRSDFSPDGTWPIGKSDLDPYFREAATILRISEMRGADLDLAGPAMLSASRFQTPHYLQQGPSTFPRNSFALQGLRGIRFPFWMQTVTLRSMISPLVLSTCQMERS